jgi:hypothetical protein
MPHIFVIVFPYFDLLFWLPLHTCSSETTAGAARQFAAASPLGGYTSVPTTATAGVAFLASSG